VLQNLHAETRVLLHFGDLFIEVQLVRELAMPDDAVRSLRGTVHVARRFHRRIVDVDVPVLREQDLPDLLPGGSDRLIEF